MDNPQSISDPLDVLFVSYIATTPNKASKQLKPMGAASSDFVDPETLPLKILLAEEVGLDRKDCAKEKEKEQNEKDQEIERIID